MRRMEQTTFVDRVAFAMDARFIYEYLYAPCGPCHFSHKGKYTSVGLESMVWGRLFIDQGTSVLKKKNCAGCDGCKKLASITNIEGTFAKGQQFL